MNAAVVQVLHGYDHGHRMLASSESIDARSLAQVDRLSDAAGFEQDPAVDSYVTGYPLPSSQYALARTWYAWELPRPNCVWTHTLILDRSVLSADKGLKRLLELFRRPSAGSDWSHYRKPLQFISSETPSTDDYASTTQRLANDDVAWEHAIAILYQTDQPAWVELAGKDQDLLALSVWQQLWPKLRREFAFSSYALEPRMLADGRFFDLYLVAPGHGSAFRVRLGAESADTSPEARYLAREASETNREFRAFLRFAGSESSSRLSMLPLTRIWRSISEARSADLDAIVGEIAQLAPAPDSMRRLKRVLFEHDTSPLRTRVDAGDVLAALIPPQLRNSVLEEDVSLRSWILEAWKASPSRTLDLYSESVRPSDHDILGSGLHSSVRHHVAEVITEVSRPTDLKQLALHCPAMVPVLLKKHRSETWWMSWADLPSELRRAAVSDSRSRLSREDLRTAVDALFHGRSDSDAAVRAWLDLAESRSSSAVPALLDVLSTADVAGIRSWRRKFPTEITEKLVRQLDRRLNERQLVVLAELLTPSEELFERGAEPWTRAVTSADPLLLDDGRALLFLVGLRDRTDFGGELVSATFPLLFRASDATLRDALDGELADLLAPERDRDIRYAVLTATAAAVGKLRSPAREHCLIEIADRDPASATALAAILPRKKHWVEAFIDRIFFRE